MKESKIYNNSNNAHQSKDKECLDQYSNDNETWTNLLSYKDPAIGLHARTDSHIFDAVTARYIKVTMNVPGSMYGYSIYEIDIYQAI